MHTVEDPNKVRIAAGGNLIQCPHKLSTRNTDLLHTSEIIWNSSMSANGCEIYGGGCKKFVTHFGIGET